MPIDREKLVRRLIKLRRIYAPYEGEDKEICASLKKDGGDNGGNFQLVIDKQGKVSVSAPHSKTPKGTTWEFDLEALAEGLRLDSQEPHGAGDRQGGHGIFRAYYGAVTVELFS
jgi:hypothetical protein